MATTFPVVKDNAVSTLASTLAAGATSLTVAAGEGAKFPSTFPFYVSIEDEIIKCEARATDVLSSLTRAQEGTSDVEHASGAAVELRVIAKSITDLNAAVNVLEALPHLDPASAESIAGLWNFIASGLGGLTDYDITIGDVATPDYGLIRIGNSSFGRTSYNAGALDLDGAVISRNMGGPVTGQIEFVWVESAGPSVIRFALPQSGVGNATYNPRSMFIAGPAVNDDDIVTVAYWQAQGIFHNLVCDTAGAGADLGVQNDLEVEGTIFADNFEESTPGAGHTFAHDIKGLFVKMSNVGAAMVQATAPSTPADGQIWLDTSTSGTGTETLALTTKTTNYTATDSDTVILCDAAAGAITITLPTAVGRAGKVFYIKKIDATANIVTTDGDGTETIDGATTQAISKQYNAIKIISDGSEWHIL